MNLGPNSTRNKARGRGFKLTLPHLQACISLPRTLLRHFTAVTITHSVLRKISGPLSMERLVARRDDFSTTLLASIGGGPLTIVSRIVFTPALRSARHNGRSNSVFRRKVASFLSGRLSQGRSAMLGAHCGSSVNMVHPAPAPDALSKQENNDGKNSYEAHRLSCLAITLFAPVLPSHRQMARVYESWKTKSKTETKMEGERTRPCGATPFFGSSPYSKAI